MNRKRYEYYVGDFETSVYEGQTKTEVWASAIVKLGCEDVHIFNSIDETWDYLTSLKKHIIVYYHNLKFDGEFWLYYLLVKKKYKQACTISNSNELDISFHEDNDMNNNTIKYCVSDMGQWYSITAKIGGYFIEFRDSLKLLPFSVSRIGTSFKTKHQKLDIEYTGYRYAGCTITDEEKSYIKNDVLVVKEALEIMFSQGHKQLTIGSCCLKEFINIITKEEYRTYFPDLYTIDIDKELYGSSNADEYIRKSYKGGWCYLVKGKENTIKQNGFTADVNSLYPSVMSSQSGNYYPVGKPTFWKGDIPLFLKKLNTSRWYYFVRIRTKFYLKKNKLPTIQIKGNLLYRSNEWLETSDIYNKKDGKYYDKYINSDNQVTDAKVTLTLTCIDFLLMQEHYDLVDLEILDGCFFSTLKGVFDDYINKYKKIKQESKGAVRELAKLFLNNLYGKLASSIKSSFKYFFEKEGMLASVIVPKYDKQAGYIAAGSAITSYARFFTITAAQKNYYGADKAGFCYADTDSIHCDISPSEVRGIITHPTDFCCWKMESCWDEAIFVRQKTYVEHITHEDLEVIEKPYYNVKCAGMPDTCKRLFVISIEGVQDEQDTKILKKAGEEGKKFIATKRAINDFKIGLLVPCKLMPRKIEGGVVLQETTYEMR